MIDRVKKGPEPIYPWSDWTDGEWRVVTQGVDFAEGTDPRSFQSYLYERAGLLGLKATAKVQNGNQVRFRLYDESEEGSPE